MAQELEEKIVIFEYTLKKLIEKRIYSASAKKSEEEIEIIRKEIYQEFDKYKSLKLLFFLVVAPVEVLFSKFPEFYAFPCGPVELDLYNAIQDDKLPSFTITNKNGCEIKDIENYNRIETNLAMLGLTSLVDEAIANLLRINKNIINYTTDELVTLSRRWWSWNSTYNIIWDGEGEYEKISSKVIKMEKDTVVNYFFDPMEVVLGTQV